MKLKFIYTFAFLMLGAASLSAQALCVPDTSITDIVSPLPFDEELNPEGGITTPACIGEPYEFVISAQVADTLQVGPLALVLDSLIINSVTGLPAGLEIGCNPDNCVITAADSVACIVIFGTPDDSNAPGEYSLSLNVTIFSGFAQLEYTLPDATIAPGEYNLTLNEAGACEPSNVRELSRTGMGLNFSPNPMSAYGDMIVAVREAGQYDYVVYNLLGQVVHRAQLRLQAGENTHSVEVQDLPKGVYLHTIQNDTKRITKRLIVN